MPTFRLPRLKANLAIVNSKGQPLDYFLRLFNIEFAQRIEQQEFAQDEILQQLAEQLLLIQQAQTTAENALEAAQNGARYADMNGAGQAVVDGVQPMTRLQLLGDITGGSLDADAEWFGQAEFFENAVSLGVVSISVQPGISGGPTWPANNSTPFAFDVSASQTGTVTYTVEITQTGAVSYVAPYSIRGKLTLTPRAT